MSAVSLPVLLPWFLCSIHSFTFECPKAAALLVRSLWSRGMLCWVWHAIISLTCTYFSSGISNVSRASFSLVAGPHKNLFQDKRRFLKLFPWMVGLRGTGRDGKGKNLVFRHTNKMIASLFFFLPPSGSCDCWKHFWKLPASYSAIDVRTRKTLPAVPLERAVTGDTLASPVHWPTVKQTSIVFHILPLMTKFGGLLLWSLGLCINQM